MHKHDLLVADLRIFLPFTINLDPYLRKVLKEDQQAMEDEGIVLPMKAALPVTLAVQQQRLAAAAAGHYPFMSNVFNPNAMDSFSTQNVMPYQPSFMPATANQSFPMPGFVTNNFPASSSNQPIEPMQRKKSIIENINPFTSELRNPSNDALSSFPVSHILYRSFRRSFFNSNFFVFYSFEGGSTSRSPLETFGGSTVGAAQGNRRIGTGFR